MAWCDASWLYRQKITIDRTRVAEDVTDFPVLITHTVTHASLFTHARSGGNDIVVTAGDGTTRLKRELVTYDAVAGELGMRAASPTPFNGISTSSGSRTPSVPTAGSRPRGTT